jgi:hypothetical protein
VGVHQHNTCTYSLTEVIFSSPDSGLSDTSRRSPPRYHGDSASKTSLVEVATSPSLAVGSGNRFSTMPRKTIYRSRRRGNVSRLSSSVTSSLPYQSNIHTLTSTTSPKQHKLLFTHTAHNGCLIRKPHHTSQQIPIIANQQHQLMAAAFPLGFISMEPSTSNTPGLPSNSTTQKSVVPSGAVNQGNDTYTYYQGDGGDGWPGMDKWVDFFSM